jgi:diguanylate cyclase (GGDEF)-like protein
MATEPNTLRASPRGDGTRRPCAPEADAGGLVLACVASTGLENGLAALADAGFTVEHGSGWGDTLARVQARRADLVLIDAAFLGGAGYRLCAAVRRAPRGAATPTLVICGREKDVPAALAAGASDVLVKPVDAGVLVRRVSTQAAVSRMTRDLEAAHAQLLQAERASAEAWRLAERQSALDPLTGLPNGTQLERLLDHALAGARGAGSGVALFLIDLDNFSVINHSLGRRNGDEALRQVAQRLTDFLRSCEVQGRGGPGLRLRAAVRVAGDQFALLLTNVGDAKRLPAFARGLLEAISRPIALGEGEIFLTASVGIAVSSAVTRLGERVLQHAETAMREAKRRGGRSYQFYSDALNGSLERRLGLDRMLRHALENGELSVQYQPIVDVDSGRVVAAEALLRWMHPVLGSVPPTEFVPLAESTGLMRELGEWVLRKACGQLRAWLDEGGRRVRMAVNISGCQLEDGDLAETVRTVLLETGIDPGLLELELSERGVLRQDKDVMAQVQRLKALGVRLTVDDFGTGDTMIAYLGQLPLDGLKIDQSFVEGLAEGGGGGVLTSAIVALAHRLKLNVTAEGVEQESQRQILRGYGCEEVQGFLFSPAVAPDEFMRLVAADAIWDSRPSGPGSGA